MKNIANEGDKEERRRANEILAARKRKVRGCVYVFFGFLFFGVMLVREKAYLSLWVRRRKFENIRRERGQWYGLNLLFTRRGSFWLGYPVPLWRG